MNKNLQQIPANLSKKQIFMKDGIFCILEKESNESREKFIERGFFILDKVKSSQGKYIDYDILLSQSKK